MKLRERATNSHWKFTTAAPLYVAHSQKTTPDNSSCSPTQKGRRKFWVQKRSSRTAAKFQTACVIFPCFFCAHAHTVLCYLTCRHFSFFEFTREEKKCMTYAHIGGAWCAPMHPKSVCTTPPQKPRKASPEKHLFSLLAGRVHIIFPYSIFYARAQHHPLNLNK